MSDLESTLKGHIDRFEGGVIEGWAARVGDESPVKLAVYDDQGILLGEGEADLYRKDLESGGINKGNHAFSFEVNTLLMEEGRSIIIKCKQTNKTIAKSRFEIERIAPSASVVIENLLGNKLSFSIYNHSIADESKILTFSVGKEKIATYEFSSKEKMHSSHIWVPAKFLDNAYHVINVGVQGEVASYGKLEIKGDPILTPWDFLNHSRKEANYISKPPSADGRYESLTLHLSDTNRVVDIEDLSIAHSVLVEGYQGRKVYPPFSLPKSESPVVSIIIPAYNKFELTYHCIASVLLAYNKTSFEVILADDCSTDETAKAEEMIGNLVVSRNEENLRFLKSCNKASELAKGDYIVFLNNDTEVKSYWLDELVAQHRSDERVGLTGSKLLNLDGTLQEAGGIVWATGEPWNAGRDGNPFDPAWNYVRQVDYVTGAAMCVTKSVWEKVGRFSEEYAPCYYEDTDLSFKVRDAGYKVLYVPHSEVIHFEGQSHGTDITKGLKHYQVINETTFRRKWFNTYKKGSKPSLSTMHLEKDRNIEQRVMVIDYATPMQGMDAGSHAALQEMKMMLALGFKVTFVPANLAPMGKYTSALQKMGVEVLYVPFYYSLDDVLQRRLGEMDAVYITRYDVAQKYVDVIKESGKPILFNNADLHFLREIRAALVKNDEEAMDLALLTRNEELEVCQKVDAILTYNTTEQAVISSHIAQEANMHITPWIVEPKDSGPHFHEREGIAFLGGYNHKPNTEAVEYMVKEVMPKLKAQRPDITFFIYGSKMPEHFKDFESENVKVKGFAKTLDGVYHDHKIFIAPLLSGAGIKGKVLDALAFATPTILTSIAAEGTGLTNGINTLIADDVDEWVEAIIKLYDDEKLWKQFSENSEILAKENFSYLNGVKKMRKIFESVGVFTSLQ
ncbi:glycosyltransferase [Alteromonas mediterranea MED64]|nr:glycosyltransferase [Alteromonas mediterranea MED64]